ncbi:MAG: HEAT repeat domain-containing protein, partial [Planctomycetota bacterium]
MIGAVGLGLLACLAAVAPAASASAGQESVGTEGTPSETVRATNPWTDLLDRDATLTFRRNAVDSAVEDLREGGLDLYGRSSAWFMLGLGNALERRSTAGIEKLAVILALGEFDPAPVAVLEALVLDPSSEVRSAALLALLRSGDDAAIARLGQFAAAGGPLGREISQLARFAKERETSDPSIAGALWLDLRYRAAVRYGLIDGQSYRILELERLGGDSDFLDAAVLPLAADS